MHVPEDAIPFGSYLAFKLYFRFQLEGRYSERSFAYVYARPASDEEACFVQVTSAEWRVTSELNDHQIKRRLALDAVMRVRSRIDNRAYASGGVYTMELDALTLESLREE